MDSPEEEVREMLETPAIELARHDPTPLTSAKPVSDSAHFNAGARGYTLRTGWVIESRMRDTMRLRWI